MIHQLTTNTLVRPAWYQRWSTYLSGVSGLLAILLTFTEQGNQLFTVYVAPLYLHYFPKPHAHDITFENKLEEFLFSASPDIDAFRNIYGGVTSTQKESDSGRNYWGYSFENDSTLLFFATSVVAPPNVSGKSLKPVAPIQTAEPQPTAIAIGFKVYPEFIHRVFPSSGLDFAHVTIEKLQNVYKDKYVITGYDADSYSGNFITILDIGPALLGETGGVFFFPNVSGCGSMRSDETTIGDGTDSAPDLIRFKKGRQPKRLEDGAPGGIFFDQLECKNTKAEGYLVGLVTFYPDRVGQSVDEQHYYSKALFYFYFLETYADKAVGYLQRRLQLVRPQN